MHENESQTPLRLELDALRATHAPATKSCDRIPYSLEIAKAIAAKYMQGLSLWKISQLPEMPSYATLLRWVKDHPDCRACWQGARAVRALHFEDAAIAAAENARGKDGDRLKFEAYKWAAEVNDPSVYGRKLTHQGDSSQPLVLQVITGFDAPNAWQTPPALRPDGTIDTTSRPVADTPPDTHPEPEERIP